MGGAIIRMGRVPFMWFDEHSPYFPMDWIVLYEEGEGNSPRVFIQSFRSMERKVSTLFSTIFFQQIKQEKSTTSNTYTPSWMDTPFGPLV